MGLVKMRIKLNSNFYDRGSIEEALRDFKDVCSGSILDNSFEIELEPREEADKLKEEFCNYILGLMKNKTLV